MRGAPRPTPRRARRRSARCTASTGGRQLAEPGVIIRSAPGELAGGRPRVALVRAVGLVDGDDVGELEDALLDPLQRVAGARDREQQERVDHRGDGDLGLADPDGLDQHDVVAGGLHQHDRLAGGAGDAAERAGARRGPDERVRRRRRAAPSGSCRRGSSRRVRVDDGSTASTATRCPAPVSRVPERLDERRLADAGHAADPDPVRAARRAAAAPAAAAAPPRGGRARVDSTSVIARASTARDPSSTPLASAGTSGVRRGISRRASAVASFSSRSTAASAITVPGPNTAAAPISCSAG